MKISVWNITGYKGRNDYDGPSDDNTNIKIAFDSRFTKEDVEEIMFSYWSKRYRSVAIKADLLETKGELK